MYKIMDHNDEFTGHEFNYYTEAEACLEHCPEGWYISSVWDNFGREPNFDDIQCSEE